MTDDLRIVGKNKLRKLFTKGSKHGETNDILLQKAKSIIIEGLNDCIETQSSKNGIDISVLMESKSKVVAKVDQKIQTLTNKTSSKLRKATSA